MIANINNDDINLIVTTKSTEVEKISPVQATVEINGSPANGKDLQSNAATLGQGEASKQAMSDEVLDETVRELNEHMKAVQRELHFNIDKDSGRTVITVMDLATQKVIRQIPNEEALNVARKLDEGIEPNLFNEYS